MKGYLQRMVAGVARKESAVHPLVGGIFLKDQQQGMTEESAFVSAPQEPRRIQADALRREEARHMEASEREVARPVQPMVDRSIEGGVQREKGQGPPMRLQPDHVETAAAAEEHRGDDTVAPERDASLPLRLHTLLVREDVDGEMDGEGDEQFAEASRRADAAADRVVRQAVDRVAAQRDVRQEMQSASEDIQIHIGRIEVIAVPPAVQRPGTMAARKAESLEEYLRRHDRRAR
jgi:hypothetical protein